MERIACLPRRLRTLFTTTADRLGHETGFVKRRRKLSGSHLAQTLVLGYLAAPTATLGQLQQTAATAGTPVSRQALSQRCTAAAATFLQQLLTAAMELTFAAPAVALPLLERFPAVCVGDSTIISLPPALATVWPGCGGSTAKSGAAALQLQVRLELRRGGLDALELQAGRASDQTAAQQTTPLPVGGLQLRDLGYFCVAQLRAVVAAGGHFLSRTPPKLLLRDAAGQRWTLLRLVTTRCRQTLDLPVTVGERRGEPLPCRLLVQRVPDQVAALRRARLAEHARRKGTRVSPTVWALCAFTVLLTDLPPEQLTLAEALVLARLRWQVELLFKLWKSAGAQVDQWRTADPWRALCTVYAKLLACLVQQWLLQASDWAWGTRSLVQAAQVVRARAAALTSALRRGERRLREEIAELGRVLAGSARLGKRRARPAAFQLLLALDAPGSEP